MATQFRLLGDIEVRVDDQPIAVGHTRQRAVLAVLLVEANRSVSDSRLIERVWGHERLPNDPAGALRTYISLLRRALASSEATISRYSSGYRLTADPASVDIHQFSHLVAEARTATDEAGAESLLGQALRLWHGEPFAGQDGAWFRTVRSGLTEAYWTARLDLVDLNLGLGRHATLLAELTDYAADRPLDERIAGQLMLALYRGGRQADALAEYQRIRRYLADQLGTDPGRRLQDLHQALLTADPTLAPEPIPGPRDAQPAPAPASPAQLPADVSGFAGRDAEMAHLDSVTGGTDPAVVISAVSGTAGVGKTALAIHWAHQAAGRFPGGQLYVNLRGYDPYQPMTSADALAGFLLALGVPGPEIPLTLDDRAARYRTEAAGRRMLIVLDNAASVEQVRPLLPGSGTCTVLVTSRDSLAGLVAVHGAHRLDLDLLSHADAQALLRRLIGPRADEAPQAVAAMADLCARLPLALRIAAELAISRPATTLTELVDEMSDHQRRLDLLDTVGDPRAAVTAVFSWSTRHLPPDDARLFRLLGLHPGSDLDAHAAAALADIGPDQARRTLDTLARAHLINRTTGGRYGMHDLLRAYAISQITAEDDETGRKALDRLFDHYLTTASAAMNRLHPAEAYRRPNILAPAPPGIDLSSADRARQWLDAHRPTLVAVCVHAADHGWPTHAVRLAATLTRYLDGGHIPDAITVHTHARNAARQTGDLVGEGRSLATLGSTYVDTGRYDLATAHLEDALSLFRRASEHGGEAFALHNLSRIELRRGSHKLATDHGEHALALFRQIRDVIGEARMLNILGIIQQRQGNSDAAIQHHELALGLFRQADDALGVASTLTNLGLAEQQTLRHDQAADHHEQALALFHRLGDVNGEASTLDNLGIIHLLLNQPGRAIEYFEHALDLYRRTDDVEGQAWALNGLGEAAQATGRPAEAITQHTAALTIAADIGDVDQQVRAHTGLAHAQLGLDRPDPARGHFERALSLHPTPTSAEADRLRAQLAAITRQP